MSTSSTASQGVHRRIESLQKRSRPSRSISLRTLVSSYDAYTFALRGAYLNHLLQPKARRLQHVPAPARPALQRQTTSVADLVKDFSVGRDSKSILPRDFMSALEKRMSGILTGKEKMPEYSDAQVKRTFAVFLNEFLKPDFRKNMEKDRRVEELILIFFSRSTVALSQTKKSPEDESYKLLVDRHVALFVRLISATLKANDWSKDRPDLTNRLQTLENKLLLHDQNLAAASQRNGGMGGTTTEVEVPRSQHVKDMPLVLTVAKVFRKEIPQVQADIDDQKDLWTEKSALRDLKMYQTNLSLNSKLTLRQDDFETQAAYDSWLETPLLSLLNQKFANGRIRRKAEAPDLSQMIVTIVQSNLELAKDTQGKLPQIKGTNGATSASAADSSSPYTLELPADLGALTLNDEAAQAGSNPAADSEPYMFIPPEPRAYYRQVVKEALASDMNEEEVSATNGSEDASVNLLSKKSLELLNELGMRWRLPQVSRLMLFMDVIREKFVDGFIDMETLNAALVYVKDPPQMDKKKLDMAQLLDRTRWTTADFVLNQQILSSLHDTLLRDLFEQLKQCYGLKPPEIASIMVLLETHIYDDPIFSGTPEDLDRFADDLEDALREKSIEAYKSLYDKEVESAGESIEFFHVMQLGKAVLKLVERIQKRYRKTPQIMGVEPATILVKVVLPSFAADARDLISTILEDAKERNEEIAVEDGFELYKSMAEMRQVHASVLPGVDFAFQVEGLLAPFVWRWIATTEEKVLGWVEAAVRQDNFRVRTDDDSRAPTEDERHSVSVIDIFQSYNQAVDQIVGLDWADDLQYAKFMTALSKAFGAGLSRYCEQLEQFFIKEMDRLTPEQQTALTQAKHERWVRIAKDALSTKEKVEPFQFLSESFVKLNNIEWAMRQLDQLEKKVDVDACAAIIESREPAVLPRQRGGEKLVFTIKIMEAEDLKACDINGLSDPYVVLGDEYQKRLAKTRIIYGNLNPRWDETVDITTQGPLNVTATIWDWDALGDHDCVGRTSIKLDPSHFRDFHPREYWLDLDTQGRLLVRVSMEGEKDDIRFYFGKAFRALKRTERDMTRKITDKLSAYIQHCLSRRTLRSLTSRGISISSVSSSVSSYFQRNRLQAMTQPVQQADVVNALHPLFAYFDENFAIMKLTLTERAMVTVMTRLWKETLSTLESLLVPPLSDKPSSQRQLNEQELEVVFKWLELLFGFFHAVDEETKVAHGVPLDVLRSPKYHDLKNLNFFYYEPTETLMRTSERMAAATADRQREAQARSATRLSAPGVLAAQPHSFGGAAGLVGLPSTRRSKSVMHSRNLGTMKQAKEEKRKEAQAEASDDMILRILRMRPEAEKYLRDRSRQKERLAAVAAAEMIVRQSLAAGAAREREIRRGQRMAQPPPDS